ncbi:MAG: hypothetical protein Q7S95_00190 [bacterium]|nr:hypothetical protein [bacterium]
MKENGEWSKTGRVVFPFLCLFIAYVLGSGVVNQVWPSERTVEVACQAIGDTFDVKSSVSCDWYAVGVLELGRTDTRYRRDGAWNHFDESTEGLLGQDEPIICQAVLWRYRTRTFNWLLDGLEHPDHLEDCRPAPSDPPM